MHCHTSIGRRQTKFLLNVAKETRKAKRRCKSVDEDVIKFKKY